MGTRINVLGAAPHITTDFGEDYVRAGEDERAAAIRIYRSWCLDTPGDTVEPDTDLEVIPHDVRNALNNFQDFN